jgi:type IV pilus assembly protein PilA
MWGPGILNLFLPFLALVAISIVLAILKPSPAVWVVACLISVLLPSAVFATFANSIYWRHVNRLIRDLPSNTAQHPEIRLSMLEQKGGTGLVAMIGLLVGVGFAGTAVLGILAANAIPAYQDYTIRSQISEGFLLTAPVKASIAEYYAGHQQWSDQEDLSVYVSSGQYVSEVTVQSGSVVISYGGKANRNIAGQRVALLPGLNDNGDIVWACGYAAHPAGVRPAQGPQGSDVAPKYPPGSCR